MSVVRVDQITNTANSYQINTTSIKFAHATMYYAVNDAAVTLTIASTGNGTQMLFNNLGPSLNITANTQTSTWTHTHTGNYVINCQYRQASGGDLWTVFGVTKAGNSTAVGVSARTGSGDSSTAWNYYVTYTVDSTSATYQLQHWSTSGKTVSSDFSGGNPSWTNYASLCGNTTGDIGRMVNYFIYRLGD